LRRFVTGLPSWTSWRRRYFDHFAKVPEASWRSVLAPELVSRRSAFEIFRAETDASSASDPLDKVFHWEMRTYLTGLFQQDDRMSMVHSLESRVPIADPRVVRFAMRTPAQLKLRGGATKWVLRQAVADRIPSEVLNRRKVGFDTPAERWMRGAHASFVRDLLTSSRARQRGLFVPSAVEQLLERPDSPNWFDVVWKLACIEAWARVFIDRDRPFADVREGTRAVA
jgi:asparagine synthase (glutamine-hydrolysing)